MTTPPLFNTWVRDIPADQSDYLDGPDPTYMDVTDKTAVEAMLKRQQELQDQGLTLLTPTTPEQLDPAYWKNEDWKAKDGS